MRGRPAASSFFIPYSGEVVRNARLRRPPAVISSVSNTSRCGSMPGLRTSSGVSTSTKPRLLKKRRMPSTIRSRASSRSTDWRPSLTRRQVGYPVSAMLTNKYVSFTGPNTALLAEEQVDPDKLEPGRALVRAEYSIISSGTEGAGFTDLVREMPNLQGLQLQYPRRTGYGHLGEVVAVGPGVENVKPGDRILTFSNHGSLATAVVSRPPNAPPGGSRSGFALHVPKEMNGVRAVATRMAGVAITALRSSSVQPGDRVVVIGLGLVGNFAAQLFQIAGAHVLGLDVSKK